MAYKQNAGRGNLPKTGNGIPTPFLQTRLSEKTIKSIEDIGNENKFKIKVEEQAKTDSIYAAKNSMRSNIYKKAQEGNEAANRTRKAGGVATVQRFENPHQYNPYAVITGEKDTYLRGEMDNKTGKFQGKKVESDFKKVSLNKKTGEYDIK